MRLDFGSTLGLKPITSATPNPLSADFAVDGVVVVEEEEELALAVVPCCDNAGCGKFEGGPCLVVVVVEVAFVLLLVAVVVAEISPCCNDFDTALNREVGKILLPLLLLLELLLQ